MPTIQPKRASLPSADADGNYIIPEMPYFKYFPMKWLLSDKVRDMGPIAHSGYRFLCDQAAIQKPIGVLPFDDNKLREYSRLTVKQFEINRDKIIENFVLYADRNECKSLHHEFLKELYREFARTAYQKSMLAHASACKRWSKNGGSAPKMPPYADPYRAYAKVISNKLITTQPSTARLEAADSAVGADDQGGETQPPLGSYLRQSLHRRSGVMRAAGGAE